MTAAECELPVIVRPMAAAEHRFVWETSLKVRRPHGNIVRWSDWLALHGDTERAALEHSRVLVADAGGVALGFLVSAAGVVRMLYVKREFRGMSIGLDILRVEASLKWSPVLRVEAPNPCWRRWAAHHRIAWEAA